MLLLGLILLIVAVLGYYRYRDFFAPVVISSLSWGGVALLYALLNHGMEPISLKGLSVLGLWNLSLITGAFLFSEVNLKDSSCGNLRSFNPWVRDSFFKISLLGMIPMCYMAYKIGTTMLSGSFLLNLRMANTGLVESEFRYGVFEYVFPVAFVSFLIELLIYRNDKPRTRLYVLAFLNVIIMFITMAKSTILFTILSALVIVNFKRRISSRKMLWCGMVIFAFMASFQLLRSGGDDAGDTISDMFYVYTLGGVPALDQIVNSEMTSETKGQYMFAFFHNAVSKLEGEKKRPEKTHKNDLTDEHGYVFVPLPTNVYTVVGPVWIDYGWLGVLLGGLMTGSFAGIFFRLARKGFLWAVIVYAYFTCVLLLQFFGEYVFTNLSYLIQIILLSLFAYKFKYVVKWQKSTSF